MELLKKMKRTVHRRQPASSDISELGRLTLSDPFTPLQPNLPHAMVTKANYKHNHEHTELNTENEESAYTESTELHADNEESDMKSAHDSHRNLELDTHSEAFEVDYEESYTKLASFYHNLEINLKRSGKKFNRNEHVQELIIHRPKAESAMIRNYNHQHLNTSHPRQNGDSSLIRHNHLHEAPNNSHKNVDSSLNRNYNHQELNNNRKNVDSSLNRHYSHQNTVNNGRKADSSLNRNHSPME